MGAGVASLFASAFPEKLDGLICLDGLGPMTCQVQDLPAMLNRAVRSNFKSLNKSKTVYDSIDQAVRARIQVSDLDERSARILVERNLHQVSNGYTWRSDSRLRHPSLYYLSEQQARAYLGDLQVPTLMVRPVDSAYRAVDLLKSRATLVPDLTWVEMPGGHHAHMDSAEYLLPSLNDFICKVNRGINTA
jgi:pimeloyl-ACP methyl ester carboxylesterase